MIAGDILYQSALRWPEREAIVYGERRYTYRQWNERVNGVAAGLANLGITKGDRVATFAFNSEALVTTAFALQKLGAVYVPVNFRLSTDELRYILRDAGIKALCFDQDLASVVAPVQDEIGIKIFFGTAGQADFAALDFEALVQPNVAEPDVAIAPGDASVVMYTSGTTGQPKGVLLDHQAQWVNTVLCALEFGLRPEDRSLHMAPLYHVAAHHVMLLPHILVGAANVILRKFSPAAALNAIREHDISTVLGVPTQYDQMATFTNRSAAGTDSLRLAVTTGSLINGHTARWARNHLCANFVCVYGMTECTSLLTILGADQWERGDNCIGRALVGVETRLIEPDGVLDVHRPAAEGARGILIARTPKLMKEYLGQPEKTADRLREGWLVTGDIMLRDADGYFFLIDRHDDMIISGGENIYPQEVERVLMQHPQVVDCAVIGMPDPTWGQVVKAFVVRSAAALTAQHLDAFCLEGRLARYKRPRFIEFVDEIPRNPSGKTLRKELRLR